MAELNSLGRDEFVAAIGWVFEHSPWVAERAWSARPFSSLDALHAGMIEQLTNANPDEQLALLCAHPDLGTRARISQASTGEQAGAGLDRLTPDEFGRLHQLNSAYRKKFGFPFLFAVKASTKHDILQALERRLESSRDDEFQEALRQVHRIARFRLQGTISEKGSA